MERTAYQRLWSVSPLSARSQRSQGIETEPYFFKQKKNAFLKQQTCFSLHKNILSIKILMISYNKEKKIFSGYCRGEIEIV